MKKSTKLFFAFIGLVVLFVLVPLSLHYRAKARLEAYKRELLASGEKLVISDLAPIPNAQGQKNAAELLQAVNGLTSTSDFFPGGMKMIKPGRARVAWRQAELNEEICCPEVYTNVWPLLRAARSNNEDTLTDIRAVLSADNIQFPLDFQQADLSSSLVDHFMMGKKLAKNTAAEVMLDLSDGQTNEAMENLLLCVAVTKLCADEPLMMSQLLRYAEMSLAVTACWESLQFKGWTDEQLSQLQREWEALDFLPAAADSLRMERARAPMDFDQARGSKEVLESMMSAIYSNPDTGLNDIWQRSLVNPREGFDHLWLAVASFPRFWIWSGIWSYDDERLNMQLYQDMIDATRVPQQRQAVNERLLLRDMKESETGVIRDFNSKCPITDYERVVVERLVKDALRAQTQAEIVTTAIALERYSLRYHKYPARLADLVPAFVKRVPVDCMDGKDLRYRLQPDGSYLLYSVGENGIDDGGDPTPPANTAPGFLKGRDWVWPVLATDQEVSAFEAGEAQKAAKEQAKRGKLGGTAHASGNQ